MSIWGSGDEVGHGDSSLEPAIRGGEVRSFAEGWSNHYPTTDGKVEQPAFVSLAHIPYFCVPGWREDDESDLEAETVGPWLRLGVVGHKHAFSQGGKPTGKTRYLAVVMDEGAVSQLVEDLRAWLAKPKVHPRDSRVP